MKKKDVRYILSILLTVIILSLASRTNIYAYEEKLINDGYNITMKRDILCLMMSYPEYIINLEKNDNEIVYIITKSGKRIIYDDKIVKNANDKISNADLQDMMESIYPLNSIVSLMDIGFDPGRARVYALLREVYGENKTDIQANLVNTKVGARVYQFNNKNGASNALQNTMKELNLIMEKKKSIYPFVYPMSGTFNYRNISGTNLISAHAFGIAVDLKSDKRDYWKWTSREDGEKRLLSYPIEIIQCFEKNNFIWGGKWGHFDILHFEYRPELILKARYFGVTEQNSHNWYSGVPEEENRVKSYIDLINNTL